MDVDDLMARGIYSCGVKVTYTDNPPECVDGQGRWNNSYVNGNIRPERHSNGGIHNFLRVSIDRLFAYCKGDNFNIHIWAWFGYFIC